MKHKLSVLFAATALAVSSAFAAVDPVLLSLAPSDANAFAGVQVDQSRNSALGQYLMSQIPQNQELDAFVTMTGFDPRRDIRQLLAASTGKGTGNGLVLARGVFPTDKLSAALTLSGAVKNTYNGVDIYNPKDGKGDPSFAFLDTSTAIMGDKAAVQATIDRYRSGVAFKGDLGNRANDLSNNYQMWFVAASVQDMLSGLGPAQPVGGPVPVEALQAILQTAGGVKLGVDAVTVALEAVTKTDKDAQALVDVCKFLTSMVQMNRNSDPNAAKIAAIFDSASITASGTSMKVSLAIPQKDIEQILPKAGPALGGRQNNSRVRLNK
jgi:hypothetical protein